MVDPLGTSLIFAPLDASMPLRRYGYQIVRHTGSSSQFVELKQAFERVLQERLEGFSGKDLKGFECAYYHDFLARHGVDHHAFIKATTRRLPLELSHLAYISVLLETSQELVGRNLRIYNDVLEFRVVRPNLGDNNPWHRDHWFPYFVPLMNVYLPISGNYCDSSLQIVPFSHLWTDEECTPTFQYGEGKKTNKDGVLYSVPEVKTCKHPIQGHRMDILPGDFALFSPRMVHGQGSNTSLDTRFSFEFRLEARP